MSHLRQDLRYGLRMLRKHPGFAATTILTVALGLAATTAIFSIVYGVLLRPLPYGDPDRLVAVWCSMPRAGYGRMFVSGALYRDWRERNHVFEDLALVRHIANFNLTNANSEPERVLGARVSPNLFRLLRVQPVLGRDFRDGEDEEGRSRIVILSHSLWQRRFGGSPNVLGTTMLLSGDPHVVIGVMGPDFVYPSREFALWKPLVLDPEELRTRTGHSFISVGRLKPGVTIGQAQADMSTVTAQIVQPYAGQRGLEAGVAPLLDDTVGIVRTPLFLMLGAVGCLLLIGCANLANLLFARALGRGRELVVRAALGAERGRLLMQSLTELLPVLIAGGVLGLIAASWILSLLVPLLPAQMPRLESISINLPVLAFSLAALSLTGLLAGLLPALQAARTDLASSMKEDARGSAGGRERARLRNLLVIGQVATAVLLLIGAGLFLRSFALVSRVDPGFRTDRILSLLLQIPRTRYESEAALATFAYAMVDRVRALPGVESAGMVNRLPLGGVVQTGSLILEGSVLPDQHISAVEYRSITSDYFKTMGIPIVAGRPFADSDTTTSARVGVIDERLARAAWPNMDPIGRRFRIGFEGLPWITVVGVVGHIRHDGLDADSRMQVYWPLSQRGQDRLALVVRTHGEPKAMTPSILGAIRAVDPDQPAFDVRSMDEVVGQSLSYRWLNMVLLTVFASVALTLATIGIYGVIAYAVGQRGREFGVRLALGARRGDIVGLVVRQGAWLAGIGAAIGVGAAFLLSRVLEGLLYQVSARDALSFVGATLLLVIVALVASYVPARRAARTDPMRALRTE